MKKLYVALLAVSMPVFCVSPDCQTVGDYFKALSADLAEGRVGRWDSLEDSRIIKIIHSNLPKNIHSRLKRLHESLSKIAPQKVESAQAVFHLSKNGPRPSLEQRLQKIKVALQKGWMPAHTSADILFSQPEDTWHLFLKKSSLKDEAQLISFLASKLGIAQHIQCDDAWLTHPGYIRRALIYLWIEKEALEKVKSAFGFELRD